MTFIGIVADIKDFEFIENELSKYKKYLKIQLININEKNVANIKNIKFETIIIANQTKFDLNDILNNAKYLIINTDLNMDNINLNNSSLKVITYGLNQKATVTVSSISEEKLLVCLQRNIEDIAGNIIEVQEVNMIGTNITNKKVYSLMVIFILQQLYKCRV